MGILWRLLAPKPVKRARRTVRKATHPVHTVTRAVTPKPVKKLQRAAHPLSLVELKTEDAVVNALQGKRRRSPARKRTAARPPTNGRTAAGPGWVPPREIDWQPQEQAAVVEQPPARERRNAHSVGSQDRLSERYARRQAEAPGRAEADRARDAARRERRAAFRAARGPWSWPEWTLTSAVAAFIAVIVLAGVAGPHPSSAINAAGASLLSIAILGGLVGVPTVAWRWYRARRAAAALLAGNPEREAGG